MLKKIASRVLSHLLKRYIDEIDESQLELEIWNGKAALEQVSISQNALTSHSLPFTVNKGIVGSIELRFPWNRLNEEPCSIEVQNVLIASTIAGNVLVNKDLSAQKSASDQDDSSSWSSTFQKILNNLHACIKNLHVRIEIPDGDCMIAIGVILSEVSFYPVDSDGNECFISEDSSESHKLVNVKDFSFYVDTNATTVIGDNFQQIMLDGITSPHQFILNPFSFSSNLFSHSTLQEFFINTKI